MSSLWKFLSQGSFLNPSNLVCVKKNFHSAISHLTSLHEKLGDNREKKLQKLEVENRKVAIALDEVSERNKELEQKSYASSGEIGGFKRLLCATERKFFEAEQKAEEAKGLRQRDDIITKLEEENRSAQDELKWKKEQFNHLEEAHRRLQDQFRLSKEEWERDKSTVLKEISVLQASLDSQTRILEGVQKRLEMCNQALAHEESRRKFLEVEVSEFKSRYENVFAQGQQERSKLETLFVQRDKRDCEAKELIVNEGNTHERNGIQKCLPSARESGIERITKRNDGSSN